MEVRSRWRTVATRASQRPQAVERAGGRPSQGVTGGPQRGRAGRARRGARWGGRTDDGVAAASSSCDTALVATRHRLQRPVADQRARPGGPASQAGRGLLEDEATPVDHIHGEATRECPREGAVTKNEIRRAHGDGRVEAHHQAKSKGSAPRPTPRPPDGRRNPPRVPDARPSTGIPADAVAAVPQPPPAADVGAPSPAPDADGVRDGTTPDGRRSVAGDGGPQSRPSAAFAFRRHLVGWKASQQHERC